MSIEVISVGSGMSMQDRGRVGWQRYGVPQGGALDQYAMAAANTLIGNEPGTPVLEIRLQGTKLRVLQDTWLALAGADSCPSLRSWTARAFYAGETLVFSEQRGGLFSYLAAPGGWVSDCFFQSVSVDVRSQLGSPIRNGSTITCASPTPLFGPARISKRILSPGARREYPPRRVLEILPGPQFESFPLSTRDALVEENWVVSLQSDRTGFRLKGRALQSAAPIRSEPVMLGSFQVPDNGQPIVTMADGPTVGGYPKIAVLSDISLHSFSQCPPGTKVALKWKDY